MTLNGNVQIDIGPTERQGITYVAFSRCTLYKNILLSDITEKRFKSYSTLGELVVKERKRLRKIESKTIDEYYEKNK